MHKEMDEVRGSGVAYPVLPDAGIAGSFRVPTRNNGSLFLPVPSRIALAGKQAPAAFLLHLPSLDNDSLCEKFAAEFAADCSPLRRAQAERYFRRDDRLRCLGAGWLLNYAVTLVAGTGAVEVKDANGKPHLQNLPDLQVSLAHAGSWVACALHGAPVGIDVETEVQPDAGMAKIFMSSRELQEYKLLPGPEKSRSFHDTWCMKEAYLKAIGTGLAGSPDQVSLHIAENSVLVEDASVTAPGTWVSWQSHLAVLPEGNAGLALCWLPE